MAQQFSVITSPVVTVFVTSSINSFGTERRFQKDLTLRALKGKLELLTGSTSSSMKLELKTKDNRTVCALNDDDALLGSYPVEDNMIIHVTDDSIKVGEFEDLSRVEKYEISEDDYAKKTDSVRAFKQRMKLGQFKEVDSEQKKLEEEMEKKKAEEEKALAEKIKPGDRCEVKILGQPAKRGSVRYVGHTDFKPGYWVGVQYDEPLGKNDGSVKGKRYFECPDKYGGFVKPAQVTVGDFPEEDLGFDDDDEM